MKQGKKVDLELLAEVIAGTVKGVRPAKRPQCIERFRFDEITRDACIRRIRYLRKAYGLQWLVDQATFNRPALETLEDSELSALLSTMEKARECAVEGIAFEDAGLVRDTSRLLPGAET